MTKTPAARVRTALLLILTALAIPACSGDGGSASSVQSLFGKSKKTGSPWVWQNPLPVGNNLWSMDFPTANDGWAAGDGGALIVTHDGGATWSAASSGVTGNLRGVSALPSGQVWAVGDGGVILSSAAGAPFTPQQSGTTADLFAVTFISPAKGWAAGSNVVLRTLDGGATWCSQALGNQFQPFLTIAFANETTGWVSTISGGVYRTLDGGATWALIGSAFTGFSSMSFVDVLHGWGVSAGAFVFHTTDGGATWESQVTPVNGFVGSLNGVHFLDLLNGWAVGDRADILHTTDGGATWTLQPAPSQANDLRAVAVTDPSHAIGVGRNGQIFSTADAGTTWTDPFPGSRMQLIGLAVSDETEAWALGGGGDGVLHTADGGAHWALQPTPPLPTSIVVARYPGLTQPVLWGSTAGQVLKSLNHGQTWTTINVPVPSTLGIDIVSFPDLMHGWVAGSQGLVMATVDGGATWTTQTSGITGDILYLRFVSATTGWLASGIGARTLRKTTDGGATWTDPLPPGTNLNVGDLAVIDANRVVVGGFFGTAPGGSDANLIRTTDGGATWTFEQIGEPFTAVRSLSFVNPQKGWLLLDGEAVYRTTDGGGTWTPLPGPPTQNYTRLRFANPNVGWIIGQGGAVLKTTSGGE